MAIPLLLALKLHNWWVDKENFESVTRKAYANLLPFPLSYTQPHRMREAILDRLAAANLLDVDRVTDLAKRCYHALFTRLAENRYFYNDKYDTLTLTHTRAHSGLSC
jgi:hypothetical protein